MKRQVIMIAGPTAVGKTKVSIELCRRLDGEILSADSMQVYRHMNIGSAKPTPEEQCGIPHHMMDVIDPAMPFSAADYKAAAETCLEDILSRGKLPIMVGGTGLYFDALLYNRDFSGSKGSEEIRMHYETLANNEGRSAVHEVLRSLDPEAAERIHPNNIRRVIRAIELYKTVGSATGSFTSGLVKNPRFEFLMYGLTADRNTLYARIYKRVDAMFDAGLIDEIKFLKNIGLSDKNQSMQGIGYKEVFRYLEGALTLDDTVQLIKQSSRRYAKRQITWFKRYPDLQWFELEDTSDLTTVINFIERSIQQVIQLWEG